MARNWWRANLFLVDSAGRKRAQSARWWHCMPFSGASIFLRQFARCVHMIHIFFLFVPFFFAVVHSSPLHSASICSLWWQVQYWNSFLVVTIIYALDIVPVSPTTLRSSFWMATMVTAATATGANIFIKPLVCSINLCEQCTGRRLLCDFGIDRQSICGRW